MRLLTSSVLFLTGLLQAKAEVIQLPAGTVFFAAESARPQLHAGLEIEAAVDPMYVQGRRILPPASRIRATVQQPLAAEGRRPVLMQIAS